MLNKILLPFVLIIFLFNGTLYSQWLKEDDFRNAKRILVELNGADKFGFMPDVDTAALRAYRNKISSYEKQFYNCIDTLKKTKPNIQLFIKETSGASEEEAKRIMKLNDKNELAKTNWKQNQVNAYYLLDYYPYNYAKFNALSELLLPYIRNYIKRFNDIHSYKIAGCIDLPNDFKDSLKQSSKTPLYVKARLGDTIAERTVIINFNKHAYDSLLNDSLPVYTEMLFYVNSPKTWDAYCESLQTFHAQKFYFQLKDDPETWCRWYSLTYRLLLSYENYFPFEIRYFEKYVFNNPDVPDNQETSVYYAAVSEYFSEKFKRKIKIRIPYMAEGALVPMYDFIPAKKKSK